MGASRGRVSDQAGEARPLPGAPKTGKRIRSTDDMVGLLLKKISPPIFYTAMFFVLSPHLLPRFPTHLFADEGDGFQNYWDMWWMQKAILDLHQSPYFTAYLHYPHGTTLVAQTLHPFNGLVSLFLPFLSVGQAYNVMVVFGFAVGGWTAFLLCREVTGSYWPSLVGGAVFTFSSYHFAHAEGHMQLVSLEWLALFVLLWRRFLRCTDRSAGVKTGLASALLLLLVLLCDFYYFFYCVVTGALFYLWVARERRDPFFLLRKENLASTAAFVLPTLLTSGVLSGSLLFQNWKDPFLGAHDASQFSMDLLAMFVPGGHWLFGHWTQAIWQTWPGNPQENSVYLGLGVVFLFFYVWKNRSLVRIEDLRFWFLMAAVFGVMSLGPTLIVAGKVIRTGPLFQIMGKSVSLPVLPYAFATKLFPPLRLSGAPVRMMIMVQLAAAIITSGGIRLILEKSTHRGRYLVTALLALTVFEYLPAPIPTTPLHPPKSAEFLKAHPESGAVYDDFTSPPRALANQTSHDRPISFGYISRIPTSVARHNAALKQAAEAGDYQQLCQKYGFRFLVASPVAGSAPAEDRLELVYSDSETRIFRICG
jgi:hypothetical protein